MPEMSLQFLTPAEREAVESLLTDHRDELGRALARQCRKALQTPLVLSQDIQAREALLGLLDRYTAEVEGADARLLADKIRSHGSELNALRLGVRRFADSAAVYGVFSVPEVTLSGYEQAADQFKTEYLKILHDFAKGFDPAAFGPEQLKTFYQGELGKITTQAAETEFNWGAATAGLQEALVSFWLTRVNARADGVQVDPNKVSLSVVGSSSVGDQTRASRIIIAGAAADPDTAQKLKTLVEQVKADMAGLKLYVDDRYQPVRQKGNLKEALYLLPAAARSAEVKYEIIPDFALLHARPLFGTAPLFPELLSQTLMNPETASESLFKLEYLMRHEVNEAILHLQRFSSGSSLNTDTVRDLVWRLCELLRVHYAIAAAHPDAVLTVWVTHYHGSAEVAQILNCLWRTGQHIESKEDRFSLQRPHAAGSYVFNYRHDYPELEALIDANDSRLSLRVAELALYASSSVLAHLGPPEVMPKAAVQRLATSLAVPAQAYAVAEFETRDISVARWNSQWNDFRDDYDRRSHYETGDVIQNPFFYYQGRFAHLHPEGRRTFMLKILAYAERPLDWPTLSRQIYLITGQPLATIEAEFYEEFLSLERDSPALVRTRMVIGPEDLTRNQREFKRMNSPDVQERRAAFAHFAEIFRKKGPYTHGVLVEKGVSFETFGVTIADHLADADPIVKRYAFEIAQELFEYGNRKGFASTHVPALIDALAAEDATLRQLAITLVEKFTICLQDFSKPVSPEAVSELQLFRPEMIVALTQRLSDPVPEVADTAIDTLVCCVQSDLLQPLPQETIDQLIQRVIIGFETADAKLRQSICEYYEKLLRHSDRLGASAASLFFQSTLDRIWKGAQHEYHHYDLEPKGLLIVLEHYLKNRKNPEVRTFDHSAIVDLLVKSLPLFTASGHPDRVYMNDKRLFEVLAHELASPDCDATLRQKAEGYVAAVIKQLQVAPTATEVTEETARNRLLMQTCALTWFLEAAIREGLTVEISADMETLVLRGIGSEEYRPNYEKSIDLASLFLQEPCRVRPGFAQEITLALEAHIFQRKEPKWSEHEEKWIHRHAAYNRRTGAPFKLSDRMFALGIAEGGKFFIGLVPQHLNVGQQETLLTTLNDHLAHPESREKGLLFYESLVRAELWSGFFAPEWPTTIVTQLMSQANQKAPLTSQEMLSIVRLWPILREYAGANEAFVRYMLSSEHAEIAYFLSVVSLDTVKAWHERGWIPATFFADLAKAAVTRGSGDTADTVNARALRARDYFYEQSALAQNWFIEQGYFQAIAAEWVKSLARGELVGGGFHDKNTIDLLMAWMQQARRAGAWPTLFGDTLASEIAGWKMPPVMHQVLGEIEANLETSPDRNRAFLAGLCVLGASAELREMIVDLIAVEQLDRSQEYSPLLSVLRLLHSLSPEKRHRVVTHYMDLKTSLSALRETMRQVCAQLSFSDKAVAAFLAFWNSDKPWEQLSLEEKRLTLYWSLPENQAYLQQALDALAHAETLAERMEARARLSAVVGQRVPDAVKITESHITEVYTDELIQFLKKGAGEQKISISPDKMDGFMRWLESERLLDLYANTLTFFTPTGKTVLLELLLTQYRRYMGNVTGNLDRYDPLYQWFDAEFVNAWAADIESLVEVMKGNGSADEQSLRREFTATIREQLASHTAALPQDAETRTTDKDLLEIPRQMEEFLREMREGRINEETLDTLVRTLDTHYQRLREVYGAQYAEVLYDLSALQSGLRGHWQVGRETIAITGQDPELARLGQDPVTTCQRLTDSSGLNQDGQPLARLLDGQFKAMIYRVDGRVVARSMLSITLDAKGQAHLLVERLYSAGFFPRQRYVEKYLYQYAAQLGIPQERVHFAWNPKMAEAAPKPLQSPRKNYRDTYHTEYTLNEMETLKQQLTAEERAALEKTPLLEVSTEARTQRVKAERTYAIGIEKAVQKGEISPTKARELLGMVSLAGDEAIEQARLRALQQIEAAEGRIEALKRQLDDRFGVGEGERRIAHIERELGFTHVWQLEKPEVAARCEDLVRDVEREWLQTPKEPLVKLVDKVVNRVWPVQDFLVTVRGPGTAPQTIGDLATQLTRYQSWLPEGEQRAPIAELGEITARSNRDRYFPADVLTAPHAEVRVPLSDGRTCAVFRFENKKVSLSLLPLPTVPPQLEASSPAQVAVRVEAKPVEVLPLVPHAEIEISETEVRRIAANYRIPEMMIPDLVARVSSLGYVQQMNEIISERLTPEAIEAWLSTEQGVAWLARHLDTLSNRARMGVPGLMLGVLALLGAEELATIIGLDPTYHEFERFAFVVGMSHLANVGGGKAMQLAWRKEMLLPYELVAVRPSQQVARQGMTLIYLHSEHIFSKGFEEAIIANFSTARGAARTTLKGGALLIQFPYKLSMGMGLGVFASKLSDATIGQLLPEGSDVQHLVNFSSFFAPDVLRIVFGSPKNQAFALGTAAIGRTFGAGFLVDLGAMAAYKAAYGSTSGYYAWVDQRAAELKDDAEGTNVSLYDSVIVYGGDAVLSVPGNLLDQGLELVAPRSAAWADSLRSDGFEKNNYWLQVRDEDWEDSQALQAQLRTRALADLVLGTEDIRYTPEFYQSLDGDEIPDEKQQLLAQLHFIALDVNDEIRWFTDEDGVVTDKLLYYQFLGIADADAVADDLPAIEEAILFQRKVTLMLTIFTEPDDACRDDLIALAAQVGLVDSEGHYDPEIVTAAISKFPEVMLAMQGDDIHLSNRL